MRTVQFRRQRIRAALKEAPATAWELADELGWPMKICSAWLGLMRTEGQVVVVGQVRADNKYPRNLYALVDDPTWMKGGYARPDRFPCPR